MSTRGIVLRLSLFLVAVIFGCLLFWFFGGIAWLGTRVFPPKLPKDMPRNSVWIEAPALPISWHHGWWFGCGISQSGQANYCRLVGADDQQVYGGDYLSCASQSVVAPANLVLIPPNQSAQMWLTDKRLPEMAPIAYLKNGDVLLPVAAIDRCEQVKKIGTRP
jgi:hypothetical protein